MVMLALKVIFVSVWRVTALFRQLALLEIQMVEQEGELQKKEELLLACSLQASTSVPLPTSVQAQPAAGAATSVNLKSTTIDFSDPFIGDLIANHSVVSVIVDDIAKSKDVKVDIFAVDDTTGRLQASLTGPSEDGIAAVQQEIQLLDRQLQFDIESKTMQFSCMFAPILLSADVIKALSDLELSHHLEISVVDRSRGHLSVEEFSLHLIPKVAGRAMCLTDLDDFRRPSQPIYVNYEWKVNGKQFKNFHLGTTNSKYLSTLYCSNQTTKATITIGGNPYHADVNSLQLVNIATGEKYTLIKEYKQPVWSYETSTNTFIEHSAEDSDALENLYRYGGSYVTLAGGKYTLDLNTMQQVNIETAETRFML